MMDSISEDKIEKIKKIASSFKNSFLKGLNPREYIEEISKDKMLISLKEGSLPVGIQAEIRKGQNKKIDILISEEVNYCNKLFSFFHELGHLFLHSGYYQNISDDKKEGDLLFRDTPMRNGFHREEEEADLFAFSALLFDDREPQANEEFAKKSCIPLRILKKYSEQNHSR